MHNDIIYYKRASSKNEFLNEHNRKLIIKNKVHTLHVAISGNISRNLNVLFLFYSHFNLLFLSYEYFCFQRKLFTCDYVFFGTDLQYYIKYIIHFNEKHLSYTTSKIKTVKIKSIMSFKFNDSYALSFS